MGRRFASTLLSNEKYKKAIECIIYKDYLSAEDYLQDLSSTYEHSHNEYQTIVRKLLSLAIIQNTTHIEKLLLRYYNTITESEVK